MTARRYCDTCDRIRVWTVDNSSQQAVRCMTCGLVEQTDGLDLARVRTGSVGGFPHHTGCTGGEPKPRRDPVQPGLTIFECPTCHAYIWGRGNA